MSRSADPYCPHGLPSFHSRPPRHHHGLGPGPESGTLGRGSRGQVFPLRPWAPVPQWYAPGRAGPLNRVTCPPRRRAGPPQHELSPSARLQTTNGRAQPCAPTTTRTPGVEEGRGSASITQDEVFRRSLRSQPLAARNCRDPLVIRRIHREAPGRAEPIARCPAQWLHHTWTQHRIQALPDRPADKQPALTPRRTARLGSPSVILVPVNLPLGRLANQPSTV